MSMDWEPNDTVSVDAAILSAEIRTARNGNFLSMVLTDGEREFAAKVWQYPKEIVPPTNMVYNFIGTCVEFNGALEVHVRKIVPKPELSLNYFRKRGLHSLEELQLLLDRLLLEIENEQLRNVVGNMLSLESFCLAPAAKSIHHNHVHGLLEHSVSVARIAMNIARSLNALQYPHQVNVDEVIAGALLHDIGKVQGYEWAGTAVQITDKEKLFGHLTVGYELWLNTFGTGGCERTLRDRIAHIILSHHGKLEWGSPVEPKTVEAFIVHTADMLDSRYSSMQQFTPGQDGWTSFIRAFNSELLLS